MNQNEKISVIIASGIEQCQMKYNSEFLMGLPKMSERHPVGSRRARRLRRLMGLEAI